MSTETAAAELNPRKELIYKPSPTQLHNAMLRGMNRRRVRVYRDAQIQRIRSRNAARRLARAIAKGEIEADPSIIGVCRHLAARGEQRVVGKNWRKPRPGRRL